MKKLTVLAVTIAGVAVSAPVFAKSPFDGTWKADIKSTQLEEKPIVLELKNGTYHCRSCTPTAVSVKADGAFHRVGGQPYFDELAVKAVDARTVKMTSKKAGKIVSESTTQIARDGKTATYSWSNVAPDGSSLTGKSWRKRVAAAPKGAHALAGSWMTTGYENVSDNGTTVTFRMNGDTLHMSTPAGESYAAQLGGPETDIKGDDGGTKVRVRKLNASTLEETNLRDGKVVGVTTMTINPDGKTMRAVFENKLRGSKMRYTAHKQ